MSGINSNEAGRLHVTISAEGAEATKTALKEVGETGEKSAGKAENSFKKFGKSIAEPIQAINRLTGAIAGAVAVAVSFYGIGVKIRDIYIQATESNEEAVKRIKSSFGDAKAQLEAVEKRIRSLEQANADLLVGVDKTAHTNWGQTAIDNKRRQVEFNNKELEFLREQAVELRAQTNAKERLNALEDKRAKAQEQEKKRLEDIRAVDADLLKFREMQAEAYADAAAKAEEYEKQRLESVKETDELMRSFLRAQDEAFKKATAAQEKMRDEARKAAMDQREFIRSMREEIGKAFPAEKIMSDLGRIVSQLERIAQQRGGR